MSTACILTGSPHVNGSSDAIARLLAQGLHKGGVLAETLAVRDYRVQPCTACNHCARHPGICPLDANDDAGTLFERLLQADTLFFVIPVYFYGPPALMKSFIDRAQKFWNRNTAPPPRPRLAQAVFCAARTKGDRLFEANQLILRCFLRALGFRLAEPLLLRGVENPQDLIQNNFNSTIMEMGHAAARASLLTPQ
ncbi:MAG: flavodoxin family protein [Bilophila sp.]